MAEPLGLSEVAKWQYRVFRATAGKELSAANLTNETFDLILDALIGYSLTGAPSDVYADLILWSPRTFSNYRINNKSSFPAPFESFW